MIENLRQRNANLRGCDELARLAVDSWPSDGGRSSQEKSVPQLEKKRLRQGRKLADAGLSKIPEDVLAGPITGERPAERA